MKKIFLSLILLTQIAHAEFFPRGSGNTLGLSCADGEVPEWSGTGFNLCLAPSGAGTVTSVNTNSTTSSILVNTANVIGTAVATIALKTQVKNTLLVGPTTGSDAAPTFRLLVGADLPNPAASTLGGVNSKAAVSNNFLTSIGTDGSITQAQPSFSNISGTATGAQLPTFTGDVTNSSAAMTVAKIQTTTVSGTTGSGNVVFSASPTLTGTVALPSATLSGTLKIGNYHIEPSESDLGNSGTTLAFDLSTANIFTTTLNNNVTITISNPVAGAAYAFVLTQDGGGSKIVTWAGTSIKWGGGTSTLSTAASSIDKVSCVYNGATTTLLCDLGKGYQ